MTTSIDRWVFLTAITAMFGLWFSIQLPTEKAWTEAKYAALVERIDVETARADAEAKRQEPAVYRTKADKLRGIWEVFMAGRE